MPNPSPSSTSRPALGIRVQLFVGAVIGCGAFVLASSIYSLTVHGISVEWLILLALTILSGLATLRIPAMPISFSISDTFSIVAALLVGPAAGAVTAAVDGLVLSFRMARDRRSMHRVLFNTASPAIATWIAAQAFVAVAGPSPALGSIDAAVRLLVALALFGGLAFGLNTGVVAAVIGLQTGKPIVQGWREHFVGLWVTYFGGIFAAMLMLVLPHNSALEILIVIAPLPVLLYVTHRQAQGRAEDQIDHLGKMNRVYIAAIEALAQAIDAKDQVTSDHIRRVQDRSLRLARSLGVTDDGELQAIMAASLLHDVGKLGIPEHILNKPGKLTASEFEIMKRHAPIGADILSVIGFPYPVVPIVRHHHENWDGSGYPDGVSGDAIPIGARILAVVDCFDALTSDRPYRPRMSDTDALQVLTDRKGRMYDPEVVEAFFELHASDRGAESHLEDLPSVVDHHAPGQPAPAPSPEATSERELEVLLDLGRALAGAQSGRAIGAAVWHHLGQVVPACTCILFGADQGSDTIVPLYADGEDTDTRGPIPVGERLSGWVAATRQTVVNSDARLDLEIELRAQSPLRSALAVPVSTGGRLIAVLAFYASRDHAFTEQHRRVAEAAAHALGSSANLLVPSPLRVPAAV